MTGRRVLLGEITGVHGIRGEIVIRTYTAEPEAIAAYGPLTDDNGRAFTVTPIRSGPKGLVARIAQIEDRTAAEALRGTRLYVDRAALPPATDGSFYVTDLVGLDACDATGSKIGRIVAVHNFGAGDIVEVSREGQRATELVPFTDAAVPEVDLDRGRVTIVFPETTDDDEPSPGDHSDDLEKKG